MKMRTILIRKAWMTMVMAGALSACSTWQPAPLSTEAWLQQIAQQPMPAVLLLGEQHDATAHHQWEQRTVQTLAQRGQLAAVVLEMADDGHSTQALPATATEADVQQALQWNDKGWPWKHYGPTVMTAVRAGVPVFGGNLPRAQMQAVMQQAKWDSHLPPAAWQRQREAIRSGHCDLLPEAQITPMARIQLAKDARMAHTLEQQLQPGKTVLLIAGRGHVLRSVGVPAWLPAETSRTIAIAQAGDQPVADAADSDHVVRTPAMPHKDHCAALRKQWNKP